METQNNETQNNETQNNENTDNGQIIKHLVISGGSVNGLLMYGALKHMNVQDPPLWRHSDLTSIYATSVGTMIATMICLGFDWETLDTYIINRPWEDVFNVTGEILFGSYANKGLFDETLIQDVFRPLLLAKDLSLNITFAELYAQFPIELHFYTFDLNSFKSVEISHTTFPNLPLITGIAMSSSLPGLFSPVFIPPSSPHYLENRRKCFIDGGIRLNYPLAECISKYPNLNEILGIKTEMTQLNENESKKEEEEEESLITKDSNLLEYFIEFTHKITNFLDKLVPCSSIPNEIECSSRINMFEFDKCRTIINSSAVRREWIEEGEQNAHTYLLKRKIEEKENINK